MNAVVDAQETCQPSQLEEAGVLEAGAPLLCQTLMDGARAHAAHARAAVVARHLSDDQRSLMEKRAQTPIVPLAWIRGTTQVTPEEAGERKAGRPKMNVHHKLSVDDLDQSITYLQRRTREVQKLVRGAQPDAEVTTKIVTAAIKDAIRRLSVSLSEENRDAIHNVVAGI